MTAFPTHGVQNWDAALLAWLQGHANTDGTLNQAAARAALAGAVPSVPTGADSTGATDSTSGLQAFFDAWSTAGGDAILPPGTYTVTSSLTIHPTKAGRLFAYGAQIKVGGSFAVGSSPVLFVGGTVGVSIYGLSVHGNDIANRICSIVDNAANVTLVDCELCHAGQQATEADLTPSGLFVYGGTSTIHVNRCNIHHISGGTATVASLARGIEFSDPNAHGGTKNAKITDCTITDITFTGLSTDADGIHIGQGAVTASVLIDGCYFERIYKRAVKIQSNGVTVRGCTVINGYGGTSGVNVAGATDPQVYAAMSAYANDVIISDNLIIGGSWLHGIDIGSTPTTTNRVTVTGNRISGGSGAVMTGSAGIRVYGDNTCSEIQISDNYVGRFVNGIWLSTAAVGVSVVGNMINGYNVASTSGILHDGQSGTGTTRCNIVGNSGEQLTRYMVEVATLPAADLNVVGNMGPRTGFEIVTATVFATQSRRPNAVGNIGSGSTSNADGVDGTNMWQGGVFARVVKFLAALTYSASITPNATLGDWQTVVVTNATAFTINAPTNPPGSTQTQDLTVEVSNTSGGAMGAITWNAVFKLVGGAFTNPATGNKRFITFRWNGTAWVETGRAAADYT